MQNAYFRKEEKETSKSAIIKFALLCNLRIIYVAIKEADCRRNRTQEEHRKKKRARIQLVTCLSKEFKSDLVSLIFFISVKLKRI